MKKLQIILISIVSFFMLALVIYPDKYIFSVQNGLNLFVISVLPALFPFMFFSKLLTSLDVASGLGKVMKKSLKKLFNAPPVAGYIFIIAYLSGYPVGAKIIADCYEKGLIDAGEAKNISIFTSTSGPLFILGTVGISMLGNKIAGFVILISHYLGAIINGIVMASRNTVTKNIKSLNVKNTCYDNILSDSITSSIMSVAIVGGYIAIFSMLLDVLFDIKLIAFFAYLLNIIKIPLPLAEGLLSSVVEITRGCKLLSISGYPLRTITPICAGIISFGGLSVTLQSLTFAAKCKIKPLFYLKNKLSQGIISYFIATLLCLFLF